MKKVKRDDKVKGVSLRETAFNELKKEQLYFQQEAQDPDVAITDVVMKLIENTRELRELKSKGLAK